MPEWRSPDGSGSLAIHSEALSGRFEKETGECSFQGTNNFIVHEDWVSGTRRTIISECLVVSEDDRYVYFQTGGRVIEESEPLAAPRRGIGRPRGRAGGARARTA